MTMSDAARWTPAMDSDLEPVAVDAEDTCHYCGCHIRLMLGLWNDDDGCITCYDSPAGDGSHVPSGVPR